jgi:2-haloacid dehalogenase
MLPVRPVVTFDLFSALLDSRTGGSRAFADLAAGRDWAVSGAELYDRWDAANKELHRTCGRWTSFRELAGDALAHVYEQHGLDGDPHADADTVLATVGAWPLWPDVVEGLTAVRATHRVGLLSNVDDDVYAATRAAPLLDDDAVLTSERLRAYKPAPAIYERAQQRLPGLVHVATSARDVRGAAEAGIPFVRLRRPGHRLDPATPPVRHEVHGVRELPAVLAALPGRRSR